MKKVIFKSLTNYGVEIIGLVLMIITASFLSNRLSLFDYGLYATINLTMTWIEFVIIGSISRAAFIKIGKTNQKLKEGKLVLQAYLIAVFVAIFLLTISYSILGKIFKGAQIEFVLPIICIYLFISSLNNGFRLIIFNVLHQKDILIPNILRHLSKFILIFILTLYFPTYLACILGITLSNFLPFFYYLYKIGYLLTFSFSSKVFEIFKYSIPIFISTVLMRVFDIADIFLLNYFKGPAITAIYSSAHSIKMIFSILTISSIGYLHVMISKLYLKNDFESMKKAIYFIFIVLCIGTLGMPVFNKIIQFLLIHIYNQKFESSLPYTFTILLGSFLLLINNSIQVFIYVFEKRKWILFPSTTIALSTLFSYYYILKNNLNIIYLCYIFSIASGLLLLINLLCVIKLVWLRDWSVSKYINSETA